MTGQAVDEAIIDEAAQWLALLQSGQASPEERQAFVLWRNADPRRADVIQAMAAGLGVLEEERLRLMPRDSLLLALNAPSGRRRFVRNVLSLIGVSSTAAWVMRGTDLWQPPGVFSTGTGERLNLRLADGSALTLDARSRVRERFDPEWRLLQLSAGRLLVDVARDSRRPFVVETAQGRIRALGTRFVVEQDAGRTCLAMLHSQAEIRPFDGPAQVVRAGQRALFDAQRLLELDAASSADAAWTEGRLEVRNQSLATVIASLRTYRQGIIRVSPAAGHLRLSGIFPLDDSDRALQLLASSLPVSIHYYSPYWVVVDVR